MTSRQRREINRRRRVRQLVRGLADTDRWVGELGRDLDDVEQRLGAVEGNVEQLDTDVRNLEVQCDA